jgi:hypothetical protein
MDIVRFVLLKCRFLNLCVNLKMNVIIPFSFNN